MGLIESCTVGPRRETGLRTGRPHRTSGFSPSLEGQYREELSTTTRHPDGGNRPPRPRSARLSRSHAGEITCPQGPRPRAAPQSQGPLQHRRLQADGFENRDGTNPCPLCAREGAEPCAQSDAVRCEDTRSGKSLMACSQGAGTVKQARAATAATGEGRVTAGQTTSHGVTDQQ